METWKPANNAQGIRDDGSLDLSCVEYGKQMNERCVLEIDSTGADGKRGVSHESYVFQMSNWIDGDAISEMRKTEDGRSLKGKSSVLNTLSLRLLLDRGGGMKKAVWWRTMKHKAPSLSFLHILLPCDLIQELLLDALRHSKPTPVCRLSLLLRYIFSTALVTI